MLLKGTVLRFFDVAAATTEVGRKDGCVSDFCQLGMMFFAEGEQGKSLVYSFQMPDQAFFLPTDIFDIR